jgi:hypothetical protein
VNRRETSDDDYGRFEPLTHLAVLNPGVRQMGVRSVPDAYAGDVMTEHPEKQIATSADAAETPQANTDKHQLGDTSEHNGKQEAAEDEAAEQLGNFA